jgi:hypothetical protein
MTAWNEWLFTFTSPRHARQHYTILFENEMAGVLNEYFSG